jgi:hypothetical protein
MKASPVPVKIKTSGTLLLVVGKKAATKPDHFFRGGNLDLPDVNCP